MLDCVKDRGEGGDGVLDITNLYTNFPVTETQIIFAENKI